jgi:hypothetical protein
MGPICCPETSVRNYHYQLNNDPVERSSSLVTNFKFLTVYLSGEDDSGYLSRIAVLVCLRLLKYYLRRRVKLCICVLDFVFRPHYYLA